MPRAEEPGPPEVSPGDIHGLAALKAHMAASASGAFTGMHLTVQDIVPAGNKVAVRFTNSGTQTGPFMGAPPTGKHAEWPGKSHNRLSASSSPEGSDPHARLHIPTGLYYGIHGFRTGDPMAGQRSPRSPGRQACLPGLPGDLPVLFRLQYSSPNLRARAHICLLLQ